MRVARMEVNLRLERRPLPLVMAHQIDDLGLDSLYIYDLIVFVGVFENPYVEFNFDMVVAPRIAVVSS